MAESMDPNAIQALLADEVPLKSTISYEPFIAQFTGQLITFTTKSGHRMNMKKAIPVVKGTGYVLAYDTLTGEGRVLTVVI